MEINMLKGFILVISLAAISATVFDNSINEAILPVCKDLIKSASTRNVRAPVPLSTTDLEGTWFSKSCETRPGLEYVMRTYWFSSDGKMVLQLRVYEDSSCRIPRHLIKAEGHFKLERKSYVTPGGTEADYSFDRITIKTYSTKAAKRIVKQMSKFRSCNADSILNKLMRGNEVLLYQSPWNTNQTSKVTDNCEEFLSWNELQLIRIEEDVGTKQESADIPKVCSRKEMFLGDFHTDMRYQREYRPTAYQTPLIQDTCTLNCQGCTKSDKNVSRFRRTFKNEILMMYQSTGYWASVRCEVQRYGLFLTRVLHLSSMTSSWNLKQQYYYDQNCSKPMYTILAAGSVKEANNTKRPKEIDMKIMRMSIIPDDKKFAGQLNRLPRGVCGKPGKWNLGERRDITVTGGCSPIGLLVPSKEPEIFKIEMDKDANQYLYLGQTPTWPRKRNKAVQRPTSWAPELKKCRKYSEPVEDNRIIPIANARVALEDNASAKLSISMCLNIVALVIYYAYK